MKVRRGALKFYDRCKHQENVYNIDIFFWNKMLFKTKRMRTMCASGKNYF